MSTSSCSHTGQWPLVATASSCQTANYSQIAAKFLLVVIDQNARGKKLGWVCPLLWTFQVHFKTIQLVGQWFVCVHFYLGDHNLMAQNSSGSSLRRLCWCCASFPYLAACVQVASIMLSWHELLQSDNCACSWSTLAGVTELLSRIAELSLKRNVMLSAKDYISWHSADYAALWSSQIQAIHQQQRSNLEQNWTCSHGTTVAISKLKYALQLAMTRFLSVSSMDRFVRFVCFKSRARRPNIHSHNQNQAWVDKEDMHRPWDLSLLRFTLRWPNPKRLWCTPIQAFLPRRSWSQVIRTGKFV